MNMVSIKSKANAIYRTMGRVDAVKSLLCDFGDSYDCGEDISKQYEKVRKEVNKLYIMLDDEGGKMHLDPRKIVRPKW